jgi:uncharacterized protein Yka (UPF0111/DUF47 family)
MEQNIQNTYRLIREEILNNFDTISKLLHEAEALTKIINGIDPESNKQLRDELIGSVNTMQTTISALITHTSKLFDLYEKFAKTISKDSEIVA